VVLDSAGNLYIVDQFNDLVRRVAAGTGIIATVAGNGGHGFSGDGGAATAASLTQPNSLALDPAGNLYIADGSVFRIRRVAVGSEIITTVAGTGFPGFVGDGGAATAAALSYPQGVAVDALGNLYIADTFSNRVREVFACVTVPRPDLSVPSDGEHGVSTSAKLAWSRVKGAFSYDVYLDTSDSPQKLLASDVAAPAYNPSNLDPLTTYYWKVIAKGDPFCIPSSVAASQVFSFTTKGNCTPPGEFTASANGTTITWQASARASSYDLYLSTSNPPRPYVLGLAELSRALNGLAPATSYSWKVVAHAACDATQVAETSIGTFTTAGSCGPAGTFALNAPKDGDATIPPTVTFTWSASPGAASYDFYLGSGSNPPLYLSDLLETRLVVPQLSPDAEYSWKVVAKAACDATKSVATAVRRFTVAACGVPSTPSGITAPSSVAVGATYAIRWNGADGLDAGGSYLVERASDPAFHVIDQQQTTATSASFITRSAATCYHRVRSIAGCSPAKRSAASETILVTVNTGTPTVVFSVLPQAVITKLGDKLEDQKSTFALENLGTASVQVLVGPQLAGSVPFFTIVDPFGGDSSFVTLEPRTPKTFEIHFSGPSNTQPGSYQGGIYVMSTGQPLAFTPQAYVNLKVGGDANAVAPRLLVNGLESEFAYFPPATGDDSARPAIAVDLLNGGPVAMDVAAEIGPEAWLRMEKDWNSAAVPASAFRTLRLSTQRTKAVAGSALPRYTYLTVRNKAGQSARLLVEDNGGMANSAGRSAPLGAGETSQIVPYVTDGTAIILTNAGNDPAPLDLIYTPEGSDGFDVAAVRRASIVIPPNDVVRLTNPLLQIFGKSTAGSMEIVSSKVGQLIARAEMAKGVMPLAMRGEGARLDSPHRVAGIVSSATTKTSLIVTETSGREKTIVHLTLYDASGTKGSDHTIELGRYGTKRIDELALSAGRVDVDITTGGGAVMALAVVTDRNSGAAAVMTGRTVAPEVHLSALGQSAVTAPQTFVIPGAITNDTLKTTVGISASGAAVNATVGNQVVRVDPGQTSELDVPAGSGPVNVTIDAPASIYARVRGTNIIDALPVISMSSEALTGNGSTIPLYADGLEHSIDPTHGRRTSLILTEVAGGSSTVNVRLYEPGSRTATIAEKDFTIAANGELRLDNLFASMGLESGADDLAQRRKSRINVVAVITATGGSGAVCAQAVSTDNETGDRRTIQFAPVGGVPTTPVERGVANASPPRRRAAGRS